VQRFLRIVDWIRAANSGPRRASTGIRISWAFCFLAVILACSMAYGDVGVVLDESLDSDVDRITGSGHSAVYFSQICPDNSPVRLRLCQPGEQGSVMSTYTNFEEDQPFEWNIAPLSVYLYGVADPQNRPLFASQKIKAVLEENYRQQYLSAFCSSAPCTTSKKAMWREMVGSGLTRTIYIFVVKTTVQQDLALIEKFNSAPNKNHFNGVTSNCANFTKQVINFYFPHAARAEHINDFGMTSPKAVARSFTLYALRRPELEFHVLHFAQVPGVIKLSKPAREGTEQLYHSKKLLAPMLIFASHELPFFVASYALTGRFNPEREAEEYPTAEVTDINYQIKQAKAGEDGASLEQLESALSGEREEAVGTPAEWSRFREEFRSLVDDAVSQKILPVGGDLEYVFKRLDQTGSPYLDDHGALWMKVPEGDKTSIVGLSESNILHQDSDSRLAEELLLARVDRVLKSPMHCRETTAELRKDWTAVTAAMHGNPSTLANTSGGKKMQTALLPPAE
jgi:hypothetical protein